MDKDKFTKLNDVPITHSCPNDCRCECCLEEWFKYINLSAREYQALKAYGAVNLNISYGRPILEFKEGGCEFLKDYGCEIYEEKFRPADCKLFICFKKEV